MKFKNLIILLFVILTLSFNVLIAQTNYYSAANGNLDTLTTWGTNPDGTGINPTNFTSDSCIYNIRNNVTPSIGAIWTVSGTSSKVIVGDGTNACTFTITIGVLYISVATDISNNATIKNQNVSETATSFGTADSLFNVLSGGTYEHNVDGGVIPTGTWNTGSNCNITGITNTAPAGLGQSFGNFTWNCTLQTGGINFNGVFTTVKGNFTIINSGTQYLSFITTTPTTFTLNIGGDMNIQGGTLYIFYTNTITISPIINVGGNLNISAGTLVFTYTPAGNFGSYHSTLNLAGDFNLSGTGTLNLSTAGPQAQYFYIRGNYNQSGGTLKATGIAANYIYLTGINKTYIQSGGTVANSFISYQLNSPASLTLLNNLALQNNRFLQIQAGATLTIPSTVTVSAGINTQNGEILNNGTLNCGTSIITGSSNFINSNAATLILGNPNGITSKTTASGNIQVTGGRTYNANANYTYNGSVAQNTGTGLPTTITNASSTVGGLTVNNSAGVNLTNSDTLTNSSVLTLTSGNLITGSNSITFDETIANPVETNNSMIIGEAIMNARTVGISPLNNFLGLAIASRGNNTATVSLIRNTGSSIPSGDGLQYQSIKDYWYITTTTQSPANKIITFSWLSALDYPNSLSSSIPVQVYYSLDGITNWTAVGSPVDVSGSNPRQITVTVPSTITSYTTYWTIEENLCTPVNISAISNSEVKCAGNTAVFTVTATGSLLSYQWYKLGAGSWKPDSGETNSQFSIPNIQLSDSGSYKCVVRNNCNKDSAITSLKVLMTAVLKDTIPNITKCEGSSITFQFNATGLNLSYQWTTGGSDKTGATNSAYTIKDIQPSDNTFYSCKVTNECGTKSLPQFILNVNTPPILSTIFVKQLKDLNDSVSYTLSPGGTEPFTYQWMNNGNIINGATNNTLKINPIICADSGIYTCGIGNSCDTITAKIAQLYVQCQRYLHAISGYVKYENADSTAMTNTIVSLVNSGDTAIKNTTTDATGYYIFVNLINGKYTLKCTTSKTWGGVNPVDALLVDKTYIHLNKLTDPLKRLAADVNDDGKINPIDALLIDRRYIHLIHKFTISDWLFTNPTVTLKNVDIYENIMALCAGDVNASYTPPKRITNYELRITNNNTININLNKPFDIPVYLNSEFGVQSSELGALGIKLQITNYELRIISIKSDLEGLIYNISDNEVDIAWAAENEGYNITPDKPLFVVRCLLSDANLAGLQNLRVFAINNSMQITSESVLADIDGNYIGTDKLAIPLVQSSEFGVRSSSTVSLSCYPNPFSNITNINYTILEDANVDINLYNVLGEKVAALVTNEHQQAGNHSLQYDGANLKQGVYYLRLELELGFYRKTNIMMIVR